MQIVSLSAVFYVAQKLIRDPLTRLAFGVALIMITFETSLWISGIELRYFQYWPIRFFWPAVAVPVFLHYTKKRTIHGSVAVSFTGSVGTLWNVDSGLMIVIAYAAFLVFKWIFLYWKDNDRSVEQRRHLLRAMFWHVAVFVICVVAMVGYMSLKAEHALHFSWLFKYQKVFYGLGFMMLPMPLSLSPWMPVLAVYLIGLIVSVTMWQRHPSSRLSDLLFFLSFLGLGLFIYYEGRSHILNLISVCWPAVLLAALMADRCISHVRVRSLGAGNLAFPSVVLALLLFCCFPFLAHSRQLLKEAYKNFETKGVPNDPLLAEEIQFVKDHSVAGRNCLLLTTLQGTYYGLTKTASPVRAPGIAEIITMEDRKMLNDEIAKKRLDCIIVGAGPHSRVWIGFDPFKILDRYSIVATNKSNTIYYMLPKH